MLVGLFRYRRIRFAGPNSVERFLRFGQAHAEFGEFARQGGAGEGFSRGSFQSAISPLVSKFIPPNRRVVFDRFPMNRRAGSGNSLTSVGVATIWFSRASSGC